MWTHLDIDGESSRKDVGNNNKKKINWCGGRPHPGLEREADTKVPLNAGGEMCQNTNMKK